MSKKVIKADKADEKVESMTKKDGPKKRSVAEARKAMYKSEQDTDKDGK